MKLEFETVSGKEIKYGIGVHKLKEDVFAYKKTIADDGELEHQYVVQLIIPAGATIVVPNVPYITNKRKLRMRTDAAIVCGSYRVFSTKHAGDTTTKSWYASRFKCSNNTFKYEVGTLVKARLDINIMDICTKGIHIFATEKEARQYGF